MANKTLIKVDGRTIGGAKTFIIAEVGSNHNQDMRLAYKLVDVAKECGADAVKFQSIRLDKLYYRPSRSVKELHRKIDLDEAWHSKLKKYCDKKGIIFFSCPTYPEAVDILSNLKVKLYKIASPQTATFPQLIEKVARLGKPVVISTGYCTLEEIKKAIGIMRKCQNKKIALLHCISEYPAHPAQANLRFIQTLHELFSIPVGFSDHTLGWETAVAAVAMGADIIEKHITLSRKHPGPDHFFALEPQEFKKMVLAIRNIEQAKGSGAKTKIATAESCVLSRVKMRAVAQRAIAKGKRVNKDKDIIFLRNHNGLDAWQIHHSRRIFAQKNIREGQPLTAAEVTLD